MSSASAGKEERENNLEPLKFVCFSSSNYETPTHRLAEHFLMFLYPPANTLREVGL